MYTLNCKGRLVVLDKPVIMGIVNATPDSFYSGSRSEQTDVLLQKVAEMINDGATIIDIGGQSTRPGSQFLTAAEEAERVLPAIETVIKNHPGTIISVDTFYAEVARQAVHAGALLVNDISAGDLDGAMMDTVAALDVPYIIMHMKGTPQTMQNEAHYEDVTREVFDHLANKIAACTKSGIKDVIVDPGFGFAKTTAHNFILLREMKLLQLLQRPVLGGLSRKATVYKTLETTSEKVLNGTTVLNTIALLNGASILRVHDVKEAIEAIRLVGAMQEAES